MKNIQENAYKFCP